jgi:cell wall-associated NlpC family hydrolase
VAVSGSVQQRLVRHFRRWQGVPHKYGGNDRHGIDCSGFVHLTYRELFNTRVPRTTKQLAKIGRSITRKHLRIGDLVLFKIGRRQQRHVGIYLGNGQFVHASSSRGVMQSRLDSPYWSRHYWTARRILK